VFVIAASVYYRTRCCTLYHSIVCYQMPYTADESFLTVVAGRGRGFFLGLCAAVHEACQRSLVLAVISSIRRATSIYIIKSTDYRPVSLRHSTAEAVPLTFTTPPTVPISSHTNDHTIHPFPTIMSAYKYQAHLAARVSLRVYPCLSFLTSV
jgi:hypothetical protein